MSGQLPDGTMPMNALSSNGVHDYQPPVEGVVVNVHYPADKTNRSKTEMEYDVDVISTANMGRLRNLPRMYALAGYQDGDEDILTPASAPVVAWINYIADGPNATPRLQTNGDRVIVNFVNGNPQRGFIEGVLTHRKSLRKPFIATTASPKGEYQRSRDVRGNVLVEDAKGNVVFRVNGLRDEGGKLIKGSMEQKALTFIFGDFDIRFTTEEDPDSGLRNVTTCEVSLNTKPDTAESTLFKLTPEHFVIGTENDQQGIGLGKNTAKFLSEIMTFLTSHTHVGNLGAPTPLNPSDISKLVQFKRRTDAIDDANEFFSHFGLICRERP